MGRSLVLTLAAVVVLWPGAAGAQPDEWWFEAGESEPPPAAVSTDNYEELFVRYLDAARATPQATAPDITWMAGLGADLRARSVNDLVTVQVIESIVGTGTADSSLDKKSRASVGSLLGLESKFPSWLDPTRLTETESDFEGGGTTRRAGTLTARITARVTEVLPNGDLVLEGAREIAINGDRQIVVLTGVVRPSSIRPGNVVPSPEIGQLRIRYFGRGLIRDNLQPGWLVRLFNKIF